MGVNSSRVRSQLDTDASVTLRATGGSDITSDTIATPVTLNELRTAFWHGKEIPAGLLALNVIVTKADTGGTNAYAIGVVVDDVVAMNDSPVEIAKYTLTPGTLGHYKFVIDAKMIPKLDVDVSGTGKYIATKGYASGNGTPKLNYYAWLSKSGKAAV